MKSRFFHTTANYHPKTRPIRLTGLNYDESTGYIDSVCAVLNESRYGPTFSYSPFNRPTSGPADEPESLSDLIEQECVSWFEADSCQNHLRQRAASRQPKYNFAETSDGPTRVQHPLGRAPTPSYFPWALGRGSPMRKRLPYFTAGSGALTLDTVLKINIEKPGMGQMEIYFLGHQKRCAAIFS